MQVVTVSNQKGGVGKTTTAVTLGGIAAEAGERVLLIDLDPHGSLTSYFGYDPTCVEKNVYTLFTERNQLDRAFVKEALLATELEPIRILAASTMLATLERQGIGDGMGLVLSRAVSCLASDFDRIIIDCPPQLGVLMVNALAACDKLVIPVQTEFLALKGLERMLNTLNMLGRSRGHPLSYVIVPTMFDRRTQASINSLYAVREQHGDRVWSGRIPIDTRFRDASRAGLPINYYVDESRGLLAYRSLFGFVCRESDALQKGDYKQEMSR